MNVLPEMDYISIIFSILFGTACFLFARGKKRNPWLWFLLGLFFSFVPLLVLVILPDGDVEDEVYRLKVKLQQLERKESEEDYQQIKIKKLEVEETGPSQRS